LRNSVRETKERT